MKKRFCLVLSILALLAITAGFACAWPIKSEEKLQTAKSVLAIYVKELAVKYNYFEPAFTDAYAEGLMRSANQNNGQGILISHDALKWCRVTLVLNDDESVKRVEVDRHDKNFGKTLAKFKVAQDKWPEFVKNFNAAGYAFAMTPDGFLEYYYDYEKKSFMGRISPPEEKKKNLPSVENKF